MSCDICSRKGKIVYENDSCMILLAPKPATAAHLLVAPKDHHASIESMSYKLFETMVSMANAASTLVFEGLGAQGTNIIINSAPHVTASIIPRKEGDGLNFLWPPKKLSEDDMKAAQAALKDQAFYVGKEKKEEKPVEVKPPEKKSGKYNYLIKQLTRMP